MNDDLEALERELSHWRPRALSPAARTQLAARLLHAESARRRRWAGASLAAAAAVVLAATLAWRWLGGPPELPPGPGPAPQIAQHPDQLPPTAWAYQAAWQTSPEALDALLQCHADQLLPRTPGERQSTWRPGAG